MDLALVETTLLESVSSTADNLVLGYTTSTALERSDPYDTSIRISIRCTRTGAGQDGAQHTPPTA
jgi:hypothetical protein